MRLPVGKDRQIDRQAKTERHKSNRQRGGKEKAENGGGGVFCWEMRDG